MKPARKNPRVWVPVHEMRSWNDIFFYDACWCWEMETKRGRCEWH